MGSPVGRLAASESRGGVDVAGAQRPLGRVTRSGSYSYHALAGSGSETFIAINQNPSWRAALLGTVAAGAIWCLTPKPARAGPAACITVGATATCQGDQSGGITSAGGTPDFDPATVNTLNVNSLTTNIAPTSGTHGIYFHRSGAYNSVTINSTTSPFSISVGGANTNGIDAAGVDAVTINHTGNITSALGRGISATSTYGNLTIVSSGAITSADDGINARVTSARVDGYGNFVNGAVSVNHTGNITSSAGIGVNAYSKYGNVSVVTQGTIQSYGAGILAVGHTSYGYGAQGGSVSVNHTGDIVSTNNAGIFTRALGGNIAVTVTGNITAYTDGIVATTQLGGTSGPGNITITHTGDIVANYGIGIVASSASGTATVTNTGKITAYGYGIRVFGYDGATVTHTGDILAGAIGIRAYSTLGAVTITSGGNIQTLGFGIFAKTASKVSDGYGGYFYNTNTVSVVHTGDIKVLAGAGIYARSYYGTVYVKHTGKIEGYAGGIVAISQTAGSSVSGNVTVKSYGDITTTGGSGIYAYSEHGTVSVYSKGKITSYAQGIYAIGGGNVTVTHTGGSITTTAGDGIYASSLSGAVTITNTGDIVAGGACGCAFDGIRASAELDVTITNTGNITATTGRGIFAGSNSGYVKIVNTGNITGKYGILAYGKTGVYIKQTGNVSATGSLGGIAAYSDSAAGHIKIISTGDVSATGVATPLGGGYYQRPHGIQAIAKTGGNIEITQSGNLYSKNASGIFAQTASGDVVINSTGDIRASLSGIYARSSAVGGVTITHVGNITTTTNGWAIQAYDGAGGTSVTHSGNIRGAGGILAYSSGTAYVKNTGSIQVSSYAAIYIKGDGAVTVRNTGDITATGVTTNAAIFARSVNGQVDIISAGKITSALYGILATGKTGVSIVQTGDVASQAGPAIYASSSNGAISITTVGNLSAATAGAVQGAGIYANAFTGITVNHTGNITVAAGNAVGLTSSNGSIDFTINSGAITAPLIAVRLNGGTANTVTIGAAASLTGGTRAITGGDVTINNSGVVTGNIEVTGGTNTFNNLAGGTFNSGVTVNLDGGALVSAGTVSPGGTGVIQTTTLTGSFTQGAGGRFAVDLNPAGGTSDRLDVSGTADLRGVVVPKLTSASLVAQTFTILSATGGTTNNGLSVQNSAVVTYQLSYPNPNDVQISITGVNFAPGALPPNQQGVGQTLQSAFLAGGGGLTSLLTYLSGLDAASFSNALSRLTPESQLTQVQAQLWSSFSFGNTLFSCPLPGNGQSVMGEGNCTWLQPGGRSATRKSLQAGVAGSNEAAAGITAGAQRELWSNWYLDVGFGYEASRVNADNGLASARGDTYQGGAALKYIRNNWMVAGSVSGSFARFDTSRYGIPTAGTAVGKADTGLLDLRLRFAYAFGSEAFYVKPIVDFDVVGLWRGAVNETGAGALSLNIQSQNDWLASVAPAVEFGGQWSYADFIWRPYLRAGVRFLSDDTLSATANFSGAPAGTAPFTVASAFDQTLGEVSAGLDLWQNSRFSLRVNYDGRFGAHTRENGGQLKVRAAY